MAATPTPPPEDAFPFVALSRFTVADPAMVPQVRRAFELRPHRVDEAEGFLRLEVLSPVDDPAQFWLMTFWRDEASFRSWHKSHAYKESHAGIPKGLKLVRGSARLTYLQHVAR